MEVDLYGGEAIVVFGEAMIELSDIKVTGARLGVAGDTFNSAVYLARSGVHTLYATALGIDTFSERIRTELDSENIGCDLVLTIPECAPGLYAIDVDEDGERSFTYWRSESAVRNFFHVGDTDVLDKLRTASVLYLSGITLSLFPQHFEKLIETIAYVRSNGGTVIFDTNYRAKGWPTPEHAKKAINKIAPYVSVALPTFEDEQELFGYEAVAECVEFWARHGAKEIVVKSGPEGAYADGIGWVKPDKIIKPVDTTGAGDSFNGGYLAARMKGASIGEAILAAHTLAAEVLMTPGAILPLNT